MTEVARVVLKSSTMKRMVALLDKLPLPPETALRARGATSWFHWRRATAVKSSNCIEFGGFTYDARRRLGSCSNERIKKLSDSLDYAYVRQNPIRWRDPKGLSAEAMDACIRFRDDGAASGLFRSECGRNWSLNIVCKPCGAAVLPDTGGTASCSPAFWGSYKVTVQICVERLKNEADVARIVQHEMRHALDFCQRCSCELSSPDDDGRDEHCFEAFCLEIRAIQADGRCDGYIIDGQYQQCVQDVLIQHYLPKFSTEWGCDREDLAIAMDQCFIPRDGTRPPFGPISGNFPPLPEYPY
jgi:hypothetical protein